MPARRIFIAADISGEARRRAAEHIDKMRQFAKDVRVGWEWPGKMHITLKFLGSVGDDLLDAISDAVGVVAAHRSPFEIKITGTGVFPSAKQPRVLWLGVENADGSLTEIASKLDSSLSSLGFKQEKRKFSPHLTIARIREPQKAKGLVEAHLKSHFDAVSFAVGELVVYESELRPTGSAYSVVTAGPFGIVNSE